MGGEAGRSARSESAEGGSVSAQIIGALRRESRRRASAERRTGRTGRSVEGGILDED